MILSLAKKPHWQSRNCWNGLSTERWIMRQAAPFVKQHNDGSIMYSVLQSSSLDITLNKRKLLCRTQEWRIHSHSMIWRPHHLAVSISSSTKLAPLLLSANNTASTSTITVPFQAYHSTELMVDMILIFQAVIHLSPSLRESELPLFRSAKTWINDNPISRCLSVATK